MIPASAQHITQVEPPLDKGQREDIDKIEEMMSMVKRHSQRFPNHRGSSATRYDVVLVTGTTGSVGTLILAALVATYDVHRIFAVNRKAANGSSLLDRHQISLKRQGLDPSIASSLKVTLLEATISDHQFGLSKDTYEMLREETTHIIHSGILFRISC
jgi:FlaA1/EpsC-like NDP-sugar epimerase